MGHLDHLSLLHAARLHGVAVGRGGHVLVVIVGVDVIVVITIGKSYRMKTKSTIKKYSYLFFNSSFDEFFYCHCYHHIETSSKSKQHIDQTIRRVRSCWIHSVVEIMQNRPLPHNSVSSYCYSLWYIAPLDAAAWARAHGAAAAVASGGLSVTA